MTEREKPTQAEKTELTTKPVDSTLKVEGKLIMASEGNGGGQDHDFPAPINQEPKSAKDAASEYVSSLGGRKPTFEESQTLKLMGLGSDNDSSERSKAEVSEEQRAEVEKVKQDVEAVFNLPPAELSKEAQDLIVHVLTSSPGALNDPDKLRALLPNEEKLKEILRQNGIADELVDKYIKDYPGAVVGLLAAREESYRLSQIDEQFEGRAEAGFKADDEKASSQPEQAAGSGESGGNEPPAPPEGTPSSEDNKDEKLSPEQERMMKLLAERAIQRAANVNVFKTLVEDMLSTKEFKEACDKAGIAIPKAEDVMKLSDINRLEEAIFQRDAKIVRGGGDLYMPQSLEDVSRLVMNRATPEYKKGGEREILNYDENGEVESVNTLNFLDWARNNYYLVHANNPTSDVSFFSDLATNIRTEGIGSVISFYELTFTDSNFLKDGEGKNGEPDESEEYSALKTEMLMEVFLLQLQRNPAISHVLQNRTDKEKLVNNVAGALGVNPLTRSDFFTQMFTWPSMHGESINDKVATKGRELITKRESNFLMGDATRQALAAYINIFDYDQLVRILGSDAPLFKYDYEKWDSYLARPKSQSQLDGVSIKDSLAKDSNKKKKDWYDDNGNLIFYQVETEGRNKGMYLKDKKTGKYMPDLTGKGQPHPGFMEEINIFLGPMPEQSQQDEMREKIRLSIMKNNGISYREAQIAELQAFSIAQINGIAARGDTKSVGHDWWTRPQNFLLKRKREKSPNRNSPYGSKYNMEGFRRLGLNIFEAVRDTRKRSLREIIQGGTGTNINMKSELKNHIDFKRDEHEYIQLFDEEGNLARGPRVKDFEVRHVNSIREKPGQEDLPKGKRQLEEVITTTVAYKDENGNVVDVGDLKAKPEDPKPVEPIQFKTDIQKQFVPNHLLTGASIYEWMMHGEELGLPEIVKGKDTRGNPILDHDKINKIKGGIEHDFRYLLSTWSEINFGEENLEWELIEKRNDAKMLIDKDGNVLDEDWYVLKKGRLRGYSRTDVRSDPDTFLRSRVMTRMENMFGAPALKFIQAEIERRGINKGDNILQVEDPRTGEVVGVNITAATGSDKETTEFRTAVWMGAFDYLVSGEFEAHRTRGSGYSYYNTTKAMDAKDALIYGEILEPRSAGFVTKATKTENSRLFAEDLREAILFGGLEGALGKGVGVFLQSLLAA